MLQDIPKYIYAGFLLLFDKNTLSVFSAIFGFVGTLLLGAYVLWSGAQWEKILEKVEKRILATVFKEFRTLVGDTGPLEEAAREAVRKYSKIIIIIFMSITGLSGVVSLYIIGVTSLVSMDGVGQWHWIFFISILICAITSIFWANHEVERERRLGVLGVALIGISYLSDILTQFLF